MLDIRHAAGAGDLDLARELFAEYAASINMGPSLCSQGFDQELRTLPGRYARPAGTVLLAFAGTLPAGCGALRPLDPVTCEMKRLYVRPAYRGLGAGRRLCEALIDEARSIGYHTMKLDTDHSMRAAVALYRTLGFRPIERYNNDPEPCTVYLGLDLATKPTA